MGWVISVFVNGLKAVLVGSAVVENRLQKGRKAGYTPTRLEVSPQEFVQQNKVRKQASLPAGIAFMVFGSCGMLALFAVLAASRTYWLMVLIVVAVVVLRIGLPIYQWLNSKKPTIQSVEPLALDMAAVYSITLPRSTELDLNRAHHFMQHLACVCKLQNERNGSQHNGCQVA